MEVFFSNSVNSVLLKAQLQQPDTTAQQRNNLMLPFVEKALCLLLDHPQLDIGTNQATLILTKFPDFKGLIIQKLHDMPQRSLSLVYEVLMMGPVGDIKAIEDLECQSDNPLLFWLCNLLKMCLSSSHGETNTQRQKTVNDFFGVVFETKCSGGVFDFGSIVARVLENPRTGGLTSNPEKAANGQARLGLPDFDGQAHSVTR